MGYQDRALDLQNCLFRLLFEVAHPALNVAPKWTALHSRAFFCQQISKHKQNNKMKKRKKNSIHHLVAPEKQTILCLVSALVKYSPLARGRSTKWQAVENCVWYVIFDTKSSNEGTRILSRRTKQDTTPSKSDVSISE